MSDGEVSDPQHILRFDITIGPVHHLRKTVTPPHRENSNTLGQVAVGYQWAHPAPPWMRGSGPQGQLFYNHLWGVEANRYSSRDEGGLMTGYHWVLADFLFLEASTGLGWAGNEHNFGEGYKPRQWASANAILQARLGVQICASDSVCFQLFSGYHNEWSLTGSEKSLGDPRYFNRGLLFGLGFSKPIDRAEKKQLGGTGVVSCAELDGWRSDPFSIGISPHRRGLPVKTPVYLPFTSAWDDKSPPILTPKNQQMLEGIAMRLHQGQEKVFLSAHDESPAVARRRLITVRDYLLQHSLYPVASEQVVINLKEYRQECRTVGLKGDSLIKAKVSAGVDRGPFVKVEIFEDQDKDP